MNLSPLDIETQRKGLSARSPYRNSLIALAIISLLILSCNVATTFPYLQQVDTQGVIVIVTINLGAYFMMLGSISAAWLFWMQGKLRLVYPIGLFTLIPIIACLIGDYLIIVNSMNPHCGCGG